MAESEGEIEYLEEDAEIVQQCVQFTQEPGLVSNTDQEMETSTLLVERRGKMKKKKIEDDSDYDPSEEDNVLSPPSPTQIKKKKPAPKRYQRVYQGPGSATNANSMKMNNVMKQQVLVRKKMNIRIPDYDDPLCLPVRALKTNESDRKRLTNWNNVCLQHFKKCDTMLKPEQGYTRASVRTAVFKNVFNDHTGAKETTIWSKTSVENEDGDKKSEIFQCTLPRYREKKVLGNYNLLTLQRRTKSIKHSVEVVLSKEDHKDGEALIVYKPSEALSAVYGLIDKGKLVSEERLERSDDGTKMYLQELTTTKMCAPCFQMSWRGVRRGKQKPLVCPVCGRAYLTVYNTLAHLRTHAPAHINKYRTVIARALAQTVGYHYNCRICSSKFDSIKALRSHVKQHQSTQEFACEICKHSVAGK